MIARESLIYGLRRKGQQVASRFVPDEWLARAYSRIVLGHSVNLKTPHTFNEKIQWLKINAYPNMQEVIRCADKYLVRGYLEQKGLSDILVPLYGRWGVADDVDWQGLPNSFVLKCSHGCAYNLLVPDKRLLDVRSAKKQLSRWMGEDFGAFNIERHYSKIDPKSIIAEKFLGEKITDYKFFCFNGEPLYVNIAYGLIDDRQAVMGYFNLDGSKIPLVREDYADLVEVDLPDFFPKMIVDARRLSADFSFVRVDFFVVENRYYFAEMTFTPAGGMITFNPSEYDSSWGEMLDISREQELFGDQKS